MTQSVKETPTFPTRTHKISRSTSSSAVKVNSVDYCTSLFVLVIVNAVDYWTPLFALFIVNVTDEVNSVDHCSARAMLHVRSLN